MTLWTPIGPNAWHVEAGVGRVHTTHLPFRTAGIYRLVRHPLYVGWIVAFWATPTMSVGHLLCAVLMTTYILLAIPLEERGLVEQHGERYRTYQRQVSALVPAARVRWAERGAVPT